MDGVNGGGRTENGTKGISMLQSAKQLYADKIKAIEGVKFGPITDLYFDDKTWDIRYMVVETGSWLVGKQTLISPKTFGNMPYIRLDSHLRSSRLISGYKIYSDDGEIGRISDLLIDVENWTIDQIVLKTNGFLGRKELRIPISQVNEINWEESSIFVSLDDEVTEPYPLYELAPMAA